MLGPISPGPSAPSPPSYPAEGHQIPPLRQHWPAGLRPALVDSGQHPGRCPLQAHSGGLCDFSGVTSHHSSTGQPLSPGTKAGTATWATLFPCWLYPVRGWYRARLGTSRAPGAKRPDWEGTASYPGSSAQQHGSSPARRGRGPGPGDTQATWDRPGLRALRNLGGWEREGVRAQAGAGG